MNRLAWFVAPIILASTVARPAAARAIRIGGFDQTRAADANFATGSLAAPLRDATLSSFPGSTISVASTLTPAFLANIDVLFITNAKTETSATSAYSASERTALLDYVHGGGAAFIMADGYFLSNAPAFVSPFGMSMFGYHVGSTNTPLPDPLAHPTSNGPFGLVTSFRTWYGGYFTNLGPAHPIAYLTDASTPAFAVIEAGALSPTSGRVALSTDAWVDGANEILFLNTMAWLANVPEPSTLTLAVVGVLAFAATTRWPRRTA